MWEVNQHASHEVCYKCNVTLLISVTWSRVTEKAKLSLLHHCYDIIALHHTKSKIDLNDCQYSA
jgi:hypothetical protein